MTWALFLGALLLLFPISSYSLPKDHLMARPQLESELNHQAHLPFFKKFETVIGKSTLEVVSAQNIERLKAGIKSHYDLDKYSKLADEISTHVDSDLKLIHSTRQEDAISILKQGKIKSMDSVVRDGLKKPENMISSTTSVVHDGKIGEQDAVFLALETGQLRKGLSYGSVQLTFKKKELLNQNVFYFS